MSKPTSITHPWADLGTAIEPSDAKKDEGWISAERPPFQWMNWWQQEKDNWISYLDDAFHAEHDEDGEHSSEVIRRVQLLESQNLIMNPTAAAGNYGWQKAGGGTCEWTPNDTGLYESPGGVGRYWKSLKIVAVAYVDESEKIDMVHSTPIVLSGELYANDGSSGSVSISVQPYDIADNPLGAVLCSCATTLDGEWERVQAKATTPASTAYVRIRKGHTGDPAGSLGAIRRLKFELATDHASGFSDEMSGEGVAFDLEHHKTTGLHRDGSIIEDYLADDSIVRGDKATEAPNMLFNPTGRAGMYGWRDLSALMAVTGASDFTAEHGGISLPIVGSDGKPCFHLTSGVTGFKGMASERIFVEAGWAVIMSGFAYILDLAGGGSENVTVAILCYRDNAGAEEFLGTAAFVEYTADTGPMFEPFSDSGTVTANADWIRLAVYVSDITGVTSIALRDLQVNIGNKASIFQDPSSHDQKTVCVGKPAALVLAAAGETLITYGTTAIDPSPATFASSTFTADRYMIVRVSASAKYLVEFAGAGSVELRLKKTPFGGAAAVESVFDFVYTGGAATLAGMLSGSHIVELEMGDSIAMYVWHDSANNCQIGYADPSEYAFCIEEV